MPRDLGDLAVSAANAARAMPEAENRAVRKAALYTTRTIRTEIRKATGDMRLSGVGKRGARVGAKFQMKRGRSSPTAEITATGPLHLIERDTSPHKIPNRRGKKRVVFDGKVRAYANHPGTSGQRPFERGWKKAAPKTPLIFRQEIGKAIVRAWK